MKYTGGKVRIAKHILPIMLAERKIGQWWVEPFVGGGNIIDKVQGKRIGGDIDSYLIDALTAIRDCALDLPQNNSQFTEDDYKQLRKSDNYKYKGYAGFAFSWGAKWLGGWARNARERDYVNEAYNSAIKQSHLLQGVRLVNESYLDLQIPDNSLIYCDPPYEGVLKYSHNFNHVVFWQWCREKTKDGHCVFVSEYNAPEDFECIWQKEIENSLCKKIGGKKAIEKLFRYKE